MNPDDNGLEGGYDSSVYSSSLEGRPAPSASQQPQIPYKKSRLNIPLFKLNRVAAVVTLCALLAIILAGIAGYTYDRFSHKSNTVNSQVSTGSYRVGGSLAVQQANPAALLNLGQVNELQVNGQLKVSNSIVLTPTNNAPTSPVEGQIYYNKSSNQPYFYNGSQFVSLSQALPQQVSSIGGASGSINLGTGLEINNGNLSISSSLNQLISQSGVTSIQGQKGAVTLSSGVGVSINGTQISNTGVVGITSIDGSIAVTSLGNGQYNVQAVNGAPGSTAVLLAPSIAQTDNSNNASIFINKLLAGTNGASDLINLQNNGQTEFEVNQNNAINLNANTYINGGASLEVSTGATTLGGTLDVTGLASLSGGLTSGGLTVASSGNGGGVTDSSSLQVTGPLTVGNGSLGQAGHLYLDNGGNSNYYDIQTQGPTSVNGYSNTSSSIAIPSLPVGSYSFCISGTSVDGNPRSNCGSQADTVTAPYTNTAGALTEFSANGNFTITAAPIADDSTNKTLTVGSGYTLNVGAISNNSSLSVGSTNQPLTLQGNQSTYLSASDNGVLNKLVFADPGSAVATRTQSTYSITIPDENGIICLRNDPLCGFSVGGSGVQSINGAYGAVTLNNASIVNGHTDQVQIDSASTLQAGIVQLNPTNGSLTINGSGYLDTTQPLTVQSDVQFNSLSLGGAYNCPTPTTGNLCLASNGTVYTNNITSTNSPTSNITLSPSTNSGNIVFSINGGAHTFYFPTSGAASQQICTTGITCVASGGQTVNLQPGSAQSFSGNDGSTNYDGIWLNDTGGSNNIINLQSSGTSVFNITQAGLTTLSGSKTTISSLYTNSITPSGSLTIGATGQSFLIQGNESSTTSVTNGTGNTVNLGYSTPTGNTATNGTIYYAFDNSASTSGNTQSTPYYVCTTAGNCQGSGSGITALTGSTASYIPIFSNTTGTGGSGANAINSIISEASNSSYINVAGSLLVGSGSNGTLTVGVASATNGSIVINNTTGSGSVTLKQDPTNLPGSAVSVFLPSDAGTLIDKAGTNLTQSGDVISCPNCLIGGGGGGATAVTSLNTLTGDVVLQDASSNNFATSGTTKIIIPDATTSKLGLVSINSDGNLTISGTGVLDTTQSILTTSNTTQFGGLTLGSNNVVSGNNGFLKFEDGTNDGFANKVLQNTLTANQNIYLPTNANCLTTSDTCTIPVITGSSGNLSINTTNGTIDTNSTVSFATSVTTPNLFGVSNNLGIGSTTTNFTLTGTAGISGSYSSIKAYSGTNYSQVVFKPSTHATDVFTFPDSTGEVCIANAAQSGCGNGGGGLTATGNQYYIPYFSAANTTLSTTTSGLGSYLFNNGSQVAVNTSTNLGAAATFTVNANATADATASAQINSTASTNKALVIQGASGQSVDILDIEGNNGSGNVLAGFGNTGTLTLLGGLTQDLTSQSGQGFTLSPGVISTTAGTGATLSLSGGAENGSGATTGGNVVINGGSGATKGNVKIGSASTNTITVGNSGAGAISLTTGSTLALSSTSTFSLSSSNASLTTGGALTLAGGQSPDITAATNNVNGGKSTNGLTIQGAANGGTGATTGGDVSINGGSGTSGGNINIGNTTTSQINLSSSGSAAVTIGSTSGGAVSIYGNATSSALSLQTASAGTLLVGTTNNANTIQIGSTGLTSGTQTINIGNGGNSPGGTTNIAVQTGSGTLTLQAASGISINSSLITQSYTSGASGGTVPALLTQNATIGTTVSTAVTDLGIQLTGHSVASGNNTLYGINFNTVTPVTNNNFYGIYFGGSNNYSAILQYGSNQIINGGGIIQPFAINGSGYVNLTGTGALVAGSIASGFGTINTGNNITTSATVQGGSVTATATLNAGTSSSQGTINIYDAANHAITLTAATSTAGYNLVLPSSIPSVVNSTSQCLQSLAGSTTTTVNLALGSCGGAYGKFIQLTAEYANAVLDESSDPNCNTGGTGNNATGTMISGYDPGSITDTTPQNYYQWNTTMTSLECYDIVVQIPIPADFNGFSGGPIISGEVTSGATVYAELLDTNGSYDTGLCSEGAGANNLPAISGHWCKLSSLSSSWGTHTLSTPTGMYATGSGKTMTLKLELATSSGGAGNALVGNIYIPYNSK